MNNKKLLCMCIAAALVCSNLPQPTTQAFAGTADNLSVETTEKSASENGFEIEGGVLVHYSGTATEVVIPDSVTSIGAYAFDDCSSLTSITIPNSVTSIGVSAFSGCFSLTDVNIPESVTSIGTSAFIRTKWLDDKRTENPLVIVNHILIDGRTCGGTATIPQGVVSIGDGAFYGCESITSITIPNSVSSIGCDAFYECSSLTDINIPESVVSIGANAFEYCSSLTDINIPESVSYIGAYAFDGTEWFDNKRTENPLVIVNHILIDGWTCSGTVTIPQGVVSIGDNAFAGCTSITGVTFPNSLTSIGDDAFDGCESITSITIPDSVTSIGDNTFGYCYALTTINIPDSVISIGNSAFQSCSSLTIQGNKGSYAQAYAQENNIPFLSATEEEPEDGFEIKDGVLVSYSGTSTEVVIPSGVTSIGGYAFSNCHSLTSVTIPNSVSSIGIYAFYGLSSLTNVNIPDSVTSIEESAFFGCASLTDINIPASTSYIGGRAFDSTQWINNRRAENPLVVVNHILIDGYACEGTVTIPQGVLSIANYAFYRCDSLTGIDIPNSVTSIGGRAFEGCSSLTKINIPDSVTSIGSIAFDNCSSLTDIYIPDSVTSIGFSAFDRCDSLTIHGNEGSYAQAYAQENNIPFSLATGEQPQAKLLTSCQVTVNPSTVTYNGRSQTASVTVKDGNNTLKEGTDYTVSFNNNLNAGTAQVILTGIGSYTGNVTKNFTIQKAPQILSYTKTYDKTYGSKAFTLDAKLKSGNGKLSYTCPDTKIVSVDNSGKVSIKGTGIATITVKSQETANYSASSVNISVKVSPTKQAIKSLRTTKGRKLTVRWKKDAQATGYQIQYSTDKNFRKAAKTTSVGKNKTVSKALSKLTKGKKYYVRVRSFKTVKVNGKNQTLYGAWSSAKRSGTIKK